MYMRCEICGANVIRNSNFQKHCRKCRKEKDRKYRRKYYKNTYVPLKKLVISCHICKKDIIKTCNNKKYCDDCRKGINYYNSKKRIERYNASKKYAKEYYETNKERIIRQQKKRMLKKNYGLTMKQYNRLLQTQDHKCPICETLLGRERKSHVDHNHLSGQTRGILCHNCNVGLGMFKDDINTIQKAIKYLDSYGGKIC